MVARAKSEGRRLWPLAVVTLAAAALLVWVWRGGVEGRAGMLAVAATSLAWLLFCLAWLTLFARLGGMVVSWIWLSLLLAGLLFVSLFRYRGLSEDLVPSFEPRWRAPEPSAGNDPTARLRERAIRTSEGALLGDAWRAGG